MIEHKQDSIVAAEIKRLKAEIQGDDYQVIKAMRLGVDVDEIYPLHRATYQQRIERLNKLEAQLAEIAAAEKHLAELDKR